MRGPIVKHIKHVQREEYVPTCYSLALTAHLYVENQDSIPSSPIVVTIELSKKKKIVTDLQVPSSTPHSAPLSHACYKLCKVVHVV